MFWLKSCKTLTVATSSVLQSRALHVSGGGRRGAEGSGDVLADDVWDGGQFGGRGLAVGGVAQLEEELPVIDYTSACKCVLQVGTDSKSQINFRLKGITYYVHGHKDNYTPSWQPGYIHCMLSFSQGREGRRKS